MPTSTDGSAVEPLSSECDATIRVVWERITTGKSGAQVHRGPGVYRKATPTAMIEAAKLTWLRDQGVPTPAVLDADDGWLLMEEVPGRSAAEPWPMELRPTVIDALADLTRTLHAIPVDQCPYDRTLAVTVAEAHAAAERGGVDLNDLNAQRAGWSVERLLAELARTQPDDEDLVVTHGDLCLPNVLFDQETAEVTGVIDVASAGRADRYVDLAIATRSISDHWLNPQYGVECAERFLRRYGVEPDREKISFYRLLDEFA